MRFSKTGKIYKVIRITGSQDNSLGISFVEANNGESNIDVIEWDFLTLNPAEVKPQKKKF